MTKKSAPQALCGDETLQRGVKYLLYTPSHTEAVRPSQDARGLLLIVSAKCPERDDDDRQVLWYKGPLQLPWKKCAMRVESSVGLAHNGRGPSTHTVAVSRSNMDSFGKTRRHKESPTTFPTVVSVFLLQFSIRAVINVAF